MALSLSRIFNLGKSMYKSVEGTVHAMVGANSIGSLGGQPLNASKFATPSYGNFLNNQFVRDVGGALINRALTPKPQPAVLRYATQTETNDANLEVMRQKAEEAGFNPLTVLRAGGINAYSTRTTNIPSYAPQLSKGPSYLAIAAGAAAKSYFNRPTEQQKASQALKIAQQYADLDYTRAMTTSARNAGSDVSLDGKTVDGVFYPKLPYDAEFFRDVNNDIIFKDGRAQVKGKGYGRGPNWEYRIPLTGRYGLTTDVGHTLHTTILEEASVGDRNDVTTSAMFHSLAGAWNQLENAGILPPLSSLNLSQMSEFLGLGSGAKNHWTHGLKDNSP